MFPANSNTSFLLLGERISKNDGISSPKLIQSQKALTHRNWALKTAQLLYKAGFLVIVLMQTLKYQGAVRDGFNA